MLRFAIIVCLCAALLVKGRPGDVLQHPDGVPLFPDNVPPPSRLAVHNRVARQAMPVPGQMPGMPGMPAMGGNPGNPGMEGFGNIPDPTIVIAKFQEVGREFLNGRRRRHVSIATSAAL